MHNGIKLYEDAIFTLKKILENNKDFVLLTNAPRPIQPVKEFLEKMGMSEKIRENVYTSGEAALSYLKKNQLNKKGPRANARGPFCYY